MANRQNDRSMPAQPGRDRGSSRDDRSHGEAENVRSVGDSADEFEEIEDLEEDEEEEGDF